MVSEVEVKIPFSVHTAKFGYDWSNIPEGMSRSELDACYRAAILKKPEYLGAGEVITGVAETHGRRFAYSIQVAEAWDANGRNAEYSAFAFAPTILKNRLDLHALLLRDEFRVPNRTPPKSVLCRVIRGVSVEPVAAPPPEPKPVHATGWIDNLMKKLKG